MQLDWIMKLECLPPIHQSCLSGETSKCRLQDLHSLLISEAVTACPAYQWQLKCSGFSGNFYEGHCRKGSWSVSINISTSLSTVTERFTCLSYDGQMRDKSRNMHACRFWTGFYYTRNLKLGLEIFTCHAVRCTIDYTMIVMHFLFYICYGKTHPSGTVVPLTPNSNVMNPVKIWRLSEFLLPFADHRRWDWHAIISSFVGLYLYHSYSARFSSLISPV